MAKVTNTSTGPRGAYLKGKLVWAEPGETVDADDFNKEWFEAEKPANDAKPKGKAKDDDDK